MCGYESPESSSSDDGSTSQYQRAIIAPNGKIYHMPLTSGTEYVPFNLEISQQQRGVSNDIMSTVTCRSTYDINQSDDR